MLEESLKDDCEVGDRLDAVRAASNLLFAATESKDGFCRDALLSSGREEDGFVLELEEVDGFEETVVDDGFDDVVDDAGLSDPDEFSFGMRPLGAITFVLDAPDLLAPAVGGTFPAFIASYCANLICRSFSERRASFRIRSRIFFCSR